MIIMNSAAGKRIIGWLAFGFFFVGFANAQPSSQEKTESLFVDLVDYWDQEIRERSTTNYQQQIDSLQATLTQKEDSFYVCYTLGRAYAAIKDYESSLKYILQAAKLAEDGTSEKSIIYYIKGLSADDEGRYGTAIEYYGICIQNYELIPEPQILDHVIAAYALEFSGNNYERLSNFQKGYLSLKRGLEIAESYELIDIQKSCLADLGSVEDLLGNTDDAIFSYQKALALYSEDDFKDEVYAIATLGIGSMYVEKKQAPKAEPFLKQAVAVLQELIHYSILDGEIPDQKRYESYLADALDTYGLFYLQKNQIPDALGAFQQAIELGKKTYQRPFSRELSRIFVHKASCYFKLQQYEKALEACQAAYKGILPDMNAADTLPDAADFYPESVLLEALTIQAKCYFARYEKKSSQDDLRSAIECNRLANLAASQLRRGIGHESDKLLLTDETHQRAENALAAAYALYQLDPQERHWQLGFEFAERSKANLLLEAFQDRHARLQVGLPDSILYQEKDLQRQLTAAELAFRDLKLSESPSRIALKQAEEELYHARRQYDLLEARLEKTYPTYYRLKYSSEMPTLAQMRASLLNEGEALVEYFMGDEFLYIFMLTKNESHFFRQASGKKLSDLIESTLTSLTSFKEAERVSYNRNAYQLYQKILGLLPIESYKKLIIIPDRELALVPFEALLTSGLTEIVSYADFPFLIKKHICSYAYSGNLLFHTYTRARLSEKAPKTFMGMAPGSFPGSNLAPLPHTIQEVEHLKKRLGGVALTGAQAQKEALLRSAHDFQILHLSTHAVAWDAESHTAWIALAEGTAETAKIRLDELASLRLQADITVLSACETGAGHIERGEGVMSLARAFTFAGSQATVQSLWPVRATAADPLIEAFYEGLIAGKDKATALHEAKLALLHSEQAALHAPAMWAAFVAIGDMRPISLPAYGLGWWGWIGLMSLLIVAGMGFYAYKRNARN